MLSIIQGIGLVEIEDDLNYYEEYWNYNNNDFVPPEGNFFIDLINCNNKYKILKGSFTQYFVMECDLNTKGIIEELMKIYIMKNNYETDKYNKQIKKNFIYNSRFFHTNTGLFKGLPIILQNLYILLLGQKYFFTFNSFITYNQKNKVLKKLEKIECPNLKNYIIKTFDFNNTIIFNRLNNEIERTTCFICDKYIKSYYNFMIHIKSKKHTNKCISIIKNMNKSINTDIAKLIYSFIGSMR